MVGSVALAGILLVPLCGDTVFLYNGTTIDGIVKARHEDTIELQIGRFGRIFIPLELVEAVEKNDRDGTVQATSLSLERKRESVDAIKEVAPGKKNKDETEATGEGGKEAFRGYLRKEDVKDPELRRKIERFVYDLTRQRHRNRVRAERRLIEVGEPAVPFVVEVADHENHLVRLAVMRILKKVGNEAAIPPALKHLSDENEFVRQAAVEVLRTLTGKRFGYDARAPKAAREKAAAAWRAWYEEEKKQQASPEAREDANTPQRDSKKKKLFDRVQPRGIADRPGS